MQKNYFLAAVTAAGQVIAMLAQIIFFSKSSRVSSHVYKN